MAISIPMIVCIGYILVYSKIGITLVGKTKTNIIIVYSELCSSAKILCECHIKVGDLARDKIKCFIFQAQNITNQSTLPF